MYTRKSQQPQVEEDMVKYFVPILIILFPFSPRPHYHRPHPHHIPTILSPSPPGCLYSVIILSSSPSYSLLLVSRIVFLHLVFCMLFLLCRPL